MFKKLHAKIDEILTILRLLPSFISDGKATWAVIERDIVDLKAGQAALRAVTGHTATVVAMTAQAAVPTTVPVTLSSSHPSPTASSTPTASPAESLKADLTKEVAAVDPMRGVKLP